MTAQLDLTQTVTGYLDQGIVSRFFDQMGSSLENHLTPNGYQAYVQVITWAVLERLKASNSFPTSQLNEDTVRPIVNNSIKGMCTVMPQDLGFPDPMQPCIMSRVIWLSLKFFGRELKW